MLSIDCNREHQPQNEIDSRASYSLPKSCKTQSIVQISNFKGKLSYNVHNFIIYKISYNKESRVITMELLTIFLCSNLTFCKLSS